MVKRKLEQQGDEVKKKRKVVRRQTPLQKFRQQTIVKRSELVKARKDIEIQLRHIAKDLGVLKRKK